MSDYNQIMGNEALDDSIEGTKAQDSVQGLAGNDKISGGAGNDKLYGDYADANMLKDTENSTTIEQYGVSDNWITEETKDGHLQMTQVVTTQKGATHEVTFEMAANFGGGNTSGAVEVLFNGEVVGTLQSNSGAYESHTVSFVGTGDEGKLTFRTVDPIESKDAPKIDTDGPIWSYTKEMEIGGETVEVAAIAPGQDNIFQVLNGTLHVYDKDTGSYTMAGTKATVNVNAIGFNQEDDMIYGIATSNGVDSLGNKVASSNLIMMDADGKSYVVGDTPYRSWTADFDDKGNLWAFEADMDYMMMIDVDNLDANGDPVVTTFKFPKEMVNLRVWDVAFDAETQTFRGAVAVYPDGKTSYILEVDVSQVADGGEPVFTYTELVSTEANGVTHDGIPSLAFGAAMIDGDGVMYVGGNSGNHDLDNSTGRQGGIYEVVFDADTGTAKLVLVAGAPGVGSNDGAVDPRTSDIFDDTKSDAAILIRDPNMEVVDDGRAEGFDDTISGGAGKDVIDGSIGDDTLIGDSLGDELIGGDGADEMYGGAAPEFTANGIISTYDDDGNRYDQFGNLLPEDDDMLFGGAGDDKMSGSAGHDTLDGGLGQDTLKGGSGFDKLYGAEGDDSLSGGADHDELHGGDGNDKLDGGSGNDTLNGGADADYLKGGSGDDILNGDTGNDELNGGSGDDTLNGGFGEDTLKSGSGNDVLNGGDGADKMDGGSGNDTLTGGEGRDVMKGNSGNDKMSGGDDRDTMNGGSGDDVMYGDKGNDYLNGAKGNDVLFGGEGNDRIAMGEGNDVASGGAGADTFIFKSEDTKGGKDQILDFDVDEDMLNFASLNIEDGEAWFKENVSVSDDQATVQLGQSTLELSLDSNALASDLFDTMIF